MGCPSIEGIARAATGVIGTVADGGATAGAAGDAGGTTAIEESGDEIVLFEIVVRADDESFSLGSLITTMTVRMVATTAAAATTESIALVRPRRRVDTGPPWGESGVAGASPGRRPVAVTSLTSEGAGRTTALVAGT
jgi:hypothetical protein